MQLSPRFCAPVCRLLPLLAPGRWVLPSSTQNGEEPTGGGAEAVLQGRERRHRNRALGHMRHEPAFPSRHGEPPVLFITASSTQIAPVLHVGLSALSFNQQPELSPKERVAFSPVTHSSRTATVCLVTSFLWASKAVN